MSSRTSPFFRDVVTSTMLRFVVANLSDCNAFKLTSSDPVSNAFGRMIASASSFVRAAEAGWTFGDIRSRLRAMTNQFQRRIGLGHRIGPHASLTLHLAKSVFGS